MCLRDEIQKCCAKTLEVVESELDTVIVEGLIVDEGLQMADNESSTSSFMKYSFIHQVTPEINYEVLQYPEDVMSTSPSRLTLCAVSYKISTEMMEFKHMKGE